MATLRASERAPFGSVGASRLRQFTSKTNTRKTLLTAIESHKTPTSVTKRKRDDLLQDTDADAAMLLARKKARTSSSTSSPSSLKPCPQAGLKIDHASPLATRHIATPTSLSSKKSILRPASTSAAGRTPPRKHSGKARPSAPFNLVAPPSLSSPMMPFSIDAALAGSASSYTPPARKRSLVRHGKKSWFFEIHEDTAEDELTNLMEFSTQTLDISDDESRLAAKRELNQRGKENIPPQMAAAMDLDLVAPVSSISAPISRSGGPRTPLGELVAKDFYGEGCDESSFFIVPGDDVDEVAVKDSA